MSELMHALVRVSEKAADIARACRQGESLFSVLIEEKKEGEKSKKFVTDFKTLADVLVQEVIKHDIGKQFPGIENNIFGEESNEFMNGLGGLGSTTGEYHLYISSFNVNSLQSSAGGAKEHHSSTLADSSQQGALRSVVLSTGEADCVKRVFLEAFKGGVHYAAGAGYKSLCVVLGLVDVYVFSGDTTFRWDCCSPHAILHSVGGGMADLKECLRLRSNGTLEEQPELMYHTPVQDATGADRWENKGGLIAYRSPTHLDAVLKLLSDVPL